MTDGGSPHVRADRLFPRCSATRPCVRASGRRYAGERAFGQPEPGFAESVGIEFAGCVSDQQLHDREIGERGHQHGAGRFGIVDL